MDEEERKRRLEEARNIVANNYRNEDYSSKIEEANSIINSVNPHRILDTQNSEEEIINNNNNYTDLFKNSNTNNTIATTYQSENEALKLKEEEKEKIDNKIQAMSTVKPTDGNFRNQSDSAFGNFNNAKLSTKEEVEAPKTTVKINNSVKASIGEEPRVIDKKEWDFFQSGAFEDGYQPGDILKTAIGTVADIGVNLVSGVISLPESIIDVGANIVATGQDIFGFDENAKKTRNFADYSISNTFTDVMNDIFKIDDVSLLGETTDNIFNTVGYVGAMWYGGALLSGIGKTASIGTANLGASANLGNISLKMAGHTLNLPTLAYFGGASSKLAEANAKGDSVTELERWSSATFGGTIEMITEGIFGMLGIGGSDITDDLISAATKGVNSATAKTAIRLGISAAGESAEEFMSYAGNYIADNFIIDKLGSTDFSSEWSWSDVKEQMILAFASTLIANGGGTIIQTNDAIKAAEQQIGRNLTNDEKALVTQSVISQAMVQNEVEFFNDGNDVDTGNIGMFYIATYDRNGNLSGVQPTIGIQIDNANESLDIQPVIIRNKRNGGYNTVDANTGILIDSSYYNSVSEAENGFNNKITNLDDASVTSINNKVTQANVAIQNKTNEMLTQIQNQRNASENVNTNTQTPSQNVQNDTQTGANNVNVNQNNINTSNVNQNINTDANINANIDSNNPYQTSQNEFRGNVNDNTSNYASNGLNEVSKLMSQISDNSVYGRDRVKAILRTVNKNIPTIELQTNGNATYLNSLNSDGSVALQQPIANRPYTGGQIKEIVNNAVNRADLSGINSTKTNEKGFRDVSSVNATNYVPQNKNENVGQNNELSDEEIRNIVKYNPDGREISDENYVDFLVDRYKDNKNISGVVTDTQYVESIADKAKKDIITDLYQQIQDKEFKITKELRNESGEIQNVNLDLVITKKGLNESFNKGISNEKYSVVPYLDALIKTAQDGTIRAETKMRSNIMQWYYLYNTAEINGELYGVKVDIKKTPQGDRFYVHRVNLVHKNGTANQIPAVGNGTIKINTVPPEGSSNLMRTPLEMEKSLNTLPSVNTSITQNNQSVKNNTNVTNKYIQNNGNNAQNIQKELHNRIQNAILSKNSKGRTYLGTVSDKVVNKIKSLFGIEVVDRRHVLADNDIRHIIKEHGNPEIEKAKGQIAITTKDIEKIPDIIENYDRLVEGNDNREGKTIRYIKKYSDNVSYVVEVVPEKGNALKIKTMWKKPVRVTNSQKTPSLTSKTESGLSSSTSSTSIPQTAQNVKDNTNIQDFGKKIGGARKDISATRNTVNTKQVTHNYAVKNTDTGFAVTFKNNILKDGFKTKSEAEKYITDFKENIKSNLAFVKDYSSKEKERYLIFIRNSKSLKSIFSGKEFSNKQDAENYAIALSMYLKEYGKALERPAIQKISRINVENKNATKTTGNDILNNFGFKGGEFGNWVKQSERQEFLNYTQDAFTDLAEALDIVPTSLGQNGEMNIAFGARGRGNLGGQAAVAHFEPGKRVINMTKLKGAGSLAHEYGHSIDNWLSRISGYSETGMATTNLKNPNLSERLQNSIKDVVDSMQYSISKDIAEINKKNEIYDKARKEHLEYYLKSLDNIFSGKATKYKKVKGKYEQVPIIVTESQQKDYQRIKNDLLNGKITEDIVYKTDPRTLKSEKTYPEPIDTLQKMYKEVVGRKLDEENTVYWLYRYGKPTKQITEIKSESAYLKSAIELDRLTGRNSKYFSKIEEMWARAFESYVSDKLKQKGIVDTYLVHSVNNTDYALFNPYPAGEERKNINKAFDNLIKIMKDEGILKAKKHKISIQDNGIRAERTSNTTSNYKPYDARTEQKQGFVEHLNENNYLKQLMEVDNSQGETYAHSFERRIEQEIQNVQSLGAFDNSIPVTKLSDIDNLVEDFLGTKVMKGHFRQRARGIYNTKTDTIRVKELKDMDNVLHEMGHALDLGGRIKIDKGIIANELLDAVSRHGGYENESRSIQLDEGFAEIVKEYAINSYQTKLDYPQTYAVLEAERQQNIKFNDFMAKLQNQIYNYIHQNPQNRLLSNMSIGEQTDKKPTTAKAIESKIVQTVWDRDFEVKRLANEMEKSVGRKLSPSENIYLLTRLASGTSSKIISMLSKGYIDENGNRMMPGLSRIGEILGNDPQRMNDLRAYLVAKRDLEYKAKSLKTGIRTMDSKAVVERFYNDTQIQEAAQVVYDTLDGVLQYAVNNGLITQDTAKSLRESNVFYVPFQRVIVGRGNQTGRRGAVSDVINKRTGSELDIKDVFENIVANSSNIIQQVENNNILRTLAEEGKEAGVSNSIFEEIAPPMKKIGTEKFSTWESELKKQGVDTSKLDLEKTIDLFVPNNDIVIEKDGSRIVNYFDYNGNRKYLQFYKGTEDIFNSLMGLDKNGNSLVLKIMRNLNMPLRYGATMANVGFAIPNMISDTIQATIYSEAGFIPVVDNVLGVLDILGATNKTARKFLNAVAPQYAERVNRIYDIYQQTGASSATRMNQYRESTQKLMKDIYGTKSSEVLGIKESFKPLKRLMDLLTYIPELSESSTRFRVFERNYNASLNKGMTETDARIQAAIESRDATQDFGRTGTLTGEVNKLIPFSAARVGSAYTFAEKIKANPKRTSARIAVLVVASLAIKALGYDDEEIEELNQRKKDDNFVIKIGNTVFTIKKPQGILRSIINLAEYTQDLATGHIEEGKELERLTSWLNNAIMDNMPADEISGLVPSAIAPLIENSLNKDFYYNTDIVKSWDLDLPNSEQYYDYNSQLAIWLGKIFNYSPAKIDNLFSGWLGGLGTDITGAIDWVSAKMGLSAEKPTMGAEDNAVGKRFVVNVNENSASIDEIYDREEELTKKLNGGTITEEENEELENLKAGISKLSALNKQIKAIKQDLTMSGTEKADAIRPLQQQKTDVARQALGKEPIYTENTDELDALEFYPSRSTLSYNGLTLELTEEMKQEYMNITYELYQKYAKQGIYSEQYLEVLKSKVKDAAKKKMIQKYRSQLVK